MGILKQLLSLQAHWALRMLRAVCDAACQGLVTSRGQPGGVACARSHSSAPGVLCPPGEAVKETVKWREERGWLQQGVRL